MNVVTLQCPHCGADLNITGDRNLCYCEYCGQKIMLEDSTARTEHTENINITQRVIDEAKVEEYKYKREKLKAEERKPHSFAEKAEAFIADYFKFIILFIVILIIILQNID